MLKNMPKNHVKNVQYNRNKNKKIGNVSPQLGLEQLWKETGYKTEFLSQFLFFEMRPSRSYRVNTTNVQFGTIVKNKVVLYYTNSIYVIKK